MKRWLSVSRDSYADVVPPPLSDIEIARMWRSLGTAATVGARRPSRRPPLLLGLAAAVLAAAAAFAVVLLISPGVESPALPPAPEAHLDEPLPFWELPDGSRVSLAPDGNLKLLHASTGDVELLLLHGTAEMTVPSSARRFALSAGGFEIVTRGARFRTALTGDLPDRRIEVTVHQGQVDVPQHLPDAPGVLRLSAGQSWSSSPPPSVDGP